MPIFYPSILKHNNQDYTLVDITEIRGNSYPINLLSDTGSIPVDKRKVGAIVFVSSSQNFYGFYGQTTGSWDTPANWRSLGGSTNTGEFVTTSSFNAFTSSYNTGSFTGSFTGSLFGTSSWATNAVNSNTASYVLQAVSASFATSSSLAQTASYVQNAQTASYVLQAISSSFASTASIALQVSTSISTQNLQHNVLFVDTTGPGFIQVDGGLRYNPNQDLLTTTSSYANQSLSASFATTASYVLQAISSSFASTASFAPNYQLTSGTGSMLAPYVLTSSTSSMTVLSASFASTASYVLQAVSASFATSASNSQTASYVNPLIQNVLVTGSLLVTGSNTLIGNKTITGSVFITGSKTIIGTTTITGSLNVSGSANITGGITGSLLGTASFATSASYALTASFAPNYALNPITSSGVALTFVTDTVYGTIASPESGSSITFSTAGAKVGVTNIIIHSASAAPSFATNMRKLSNSSTYTINVINYIYATYINDTEIIYSVNQRT